MAVLFNSILGGGSAPGPSLNDQKNYTFVATGSMNKGTAAANPFAVTLTGVLVDDMIYMYITYSSSDGTVQFTSGNYNINLTTTNIKEVTGYKDPPHKNYTFSVTQTMSVGAASVDPLVATINGTITDGTCSITMDYGQTSSAIANYRGGSHEMILKNITVTPIA